MAILYGGLDAKNSGEVAAALDAMDIKSEIRGDAIYVPSNKRDRARADLALQNLPRQGVAGYELLDNLSGFGITNEMYRTTFWRAKEGELARTIMSMPKVSYARVHIGAQAEKPFMRNKKPTTAAVHIGMGGGRVDERTAVAARYLVALAVADLDPHQVAVIDNINGVVLEPGKENPSIASDETAERRAQALEEELEGLLAVRVGPDAVRISVSIETSRETSTVSERILDPDSRVTIESMVKEKIDKGTEPGANVTVASNLPDGDLAQGSQGQRDLSDTSEDIKYQYSETRRDSVMQAGAIKRLGVAVLVDAEKVVSASGETEFRPRSNEELLAIEELVKSAVAFDADRGDTVTVESMRFAPTPELDSIVEASPLERMIADNMMAVIQLAVLAVVIIALALLVVRPILLQNAAANAAGEFNAELAAASISAQLDANKAALEAASQDPAALEGGADGSAALETAAQVAESTHDQTQLDEAVDRMKELNLSSGLGSLQEIVQHDPDRSAALLQQWLSGQSAIPTRT